jgi:replication factor A1
VTELEEAMPQSNTAPLLEEITRALGDKVGTDVTKEQLEVEIARYLEYGVPPEQAKRAILRHHGATATGAPAASSGERVTLDKIEPNLASVSLLVRVVHVENRQITVRGEPKEITTGILGDETMTRPFTSWKVLDVAKGDVLQIQDAYTKEYNNEPQINFGDRVRIEKVDASLLPERAAEPQSLMAGDLKPGQRGVEITGRILNVEAKEVMVKEVPKTVWSGVLGDATGKVQFSAWHDFKLKAGQVVKISGAYVRGWRGTAQLTFDDKCVVEPLDDKAVPSRKEIDHAGPVAIGRFVQGGGMLDVTIEATLIEVRPGSGLIVRCTDCNRVLRDNTCASRPFSTTAREPSPSSSTAP